MVVISHRGYWKTPDEMNSLASFEHSFNKGFGVETDIRDFQGELVISHDIPDEKCVKLKTFFELYKGYSLGYLLALNIKADGLQGNLRELLEEFKIGNYFCFDMAVPDGLVYLKYNINVFTRQSEYEMTPSFYDEAMGVWMDEFYTHWIDEGIVEKHALNQKKIGIVSPELHKRDYKKEWSDYKKFNESPLLRDRLILCTDFPEIGRDYFDA